jgi:hypothetical protein
MAKTSELTFAPEQDQPVRYIERTRSYYLGLGYDNPYVWAHYVNVPFSRLQKPLNQSVLGLITTAVQFDPSKGPQGQGAAYNAAAKFYQPYKSPINQKQDLRIAHVGIDRKNANMEEIECWFPLAAARRVVERPRAWADLMSASLARRIRDQMSSSARWEAKRSKNRVMAWSDTCPISPKA